MVVVEKKKTGEYLAAKVVSYQPQNLYVTYLQLGKSSKDAKTHYAFLGEQTNP